MEKMVIEMEKKGKIDNEEEISSEEKIMDEKMEDLVELSDVSKNEVKEEKKELDKIMMRNVEDMELNVRYDKWIKEEDIKYIGDMVKSKEVEIIKKNKIGKKYINEIKEVMD